jgi:hypothetical protein
MVVVDVEVVVYVVDDGMDEVVVDVPPPDIVVDVGRPRVSTVAVTVPTLDTSVRVPVVVCSVYLTQRFPAKVVPIMPYTERGQLKETLVLYPGVKARFVFEENVGLMEAVEQFRPVTVIGVVASPIFTTRVPLPRSVGVWQRYGATAMQVFGTVGENTFSSIIATTTIVTTSIAQP